MGLAVGVGALHADNRLVTSSRMMSLDRAVTQAGKKAIARRGERTHQVGPDANQFVRILLTLTPSPFGGQRRSLPLLTDSDQVGSEVQGIVAWWPTQP